MLSFSSLSTGFYRLLRLPSILLIIYSLHQSYQYCITSRSIDIRDLEFITRNLNLFLFIKQGFQTKRSFLDSQLKLDVFALINLKEFDVSFKMESFQ